MNRDIWQLFEIVFDSLMFVPYLLRGRLSARTKRGSLTQDRRRTCEAGSFLTTLETHGFDYQDDAACMPLHSRDGF